MIDWEELEHVLDAAPQASSLAGPPLGPQIATTATATPAVAASGYEQAYLRLHDFEDALAWGDEWERAYQDERREHLREVKCLQDRVFELEHALKAKEFEALVVGQFDPESDKSNQ